MHRALEVLGAVARTVVVATGVALLVPAAAGVGIALGVVPVEPMLSGPPDHTAGLGIIYTLAMLVLLPAGPLLVVLGLLVPGRGLPTVPRVRVRDGRRRQFAAGLVLVALGPFLGLWLMGVIGPPTGQSFAVSVVTPLLLGVGVVRTALAVADDRATRSTSSRENDPA